VSRNIARGLVAALSLAACGFLSVIMAVQGLTRADAWAALLAALAGIGAVWGPVPRPPKGTLPPQTEVPDWVVRRPAELAANVKALVDGRAGTVGITTGLYGAGGFGKTTLAQLVCADRRVRRRLGGEVYHVPVGQDVRGPAAVAPQGQ
jgi:hypothetical protein